MRWLMYALTAVVGLILLAIVVLLAMGGGRGESQLLASTEIDRPAATVFAWLTEPPRLKAWVGWLVDVRTVQAAGTGGAGARDVWVMEDRNNNNQLMEITVDTTRVEPPHRLVAQLAAPAGFEGTVEYTLEDLTPGRTRVTYLGKYRYHHWFAKLLAPVITRAAQQKLEEDLARLKQRIEAGE
jgi:uncharacterized protein YndB with AHSA1/START domain